MATFKEYRSGDIIIVRDFGDDTCSICGYPNNITMNNVTIQIDGHEFDARIAMSRACSVVHEFVSMKFIGEERQ